MRNFNGFTCIFSNNVCVNDSEYTFVNSILNSIKSTRIPQCIFIFEGCPIIFGLHEFIIIINFGLRSIMSIDDYFPSLALHELKKGDNASLLVVMISTIKKKWMINIFLFYSIVHLKHNRIDTLEHTQPDQGVCFNANRNYV